jgi:TPR repeat protein
MNGDGIEKNVTKAMELLKEASDNNHEKAQVLYGELLLSQHPKRITSTSSDVELHDITKDGWKYIERAADSGNSDAQRKMGDCFRLQLNDEAKQLSRQEALINASMWYNRASNQGDTAAQASLGILYYHGVGLQHDIGLALTWLNPAAEANQIDAIVQLAYAVLHRYDHQTEQLDSKSDEMLQNYLERLHEHVEKHYLTLPLGSRQLIGLLKSNPLHLHDWLESYRYHHNEPWLGGLSSLILHAIEKFQNKK